MVVGAGHAGGGLDLSSVGRRPGFPSGRAESAQPEPAFLGAITQRDYDGVTDDLFTAGLGWDGLQAAYPIPPAPDPSAAELRRRAIHTNYRAVLDITTAGSYGRLYGPNVALDGTVDPTPGPAKSPEPNSSLILTMAAAAKRDLDGSSAGPASIWPDLASLRLRRPVRAACTGPLARRVNGDSSTVARWPTPTRAPATDSRSDQQPRRFDRRHSRGRRCGWPRLTLYRQFR
ncbi:MAG: hypothetical protein IPL51_13090 [Candidatus Competibacteraceae bacterium]|nr:hypothetical protein [Candidatus Competibacteraceae bacterium]